jgi:hypothetical protein
VPAFRKLDAVAVLMARLLPAPLLALYAALVDAALLYAAHQAAGLILATVAGAFVGAFHFFDGLIED